MTIKQYQEATKEFASYPFGTVEAETVEAGKETTSNASNEAKWLYPVMALGEEAGEVQGKFAKAIRDNCGIITEERATEIKKELGDVCWMLSQICNECGFDLEEVMEMNIEKLKSRKARGVLHGSGDNR